MLCVSFVPPDINFAKAHLPCHIPFLRRNGAKEQTLAQWGEIFFKVWPAQKKIFQEEVDKITFFRYEKPYEKLKYQNN